MESWSWTDGSLTGTFSSSADSSESEILRTGGSVSSEQPFCLSPGSSSFSPHSTHPESGPQPPGLQTAEPDSKPLCRTEPNPQGVLRDTAGRLRADETHRTHLLPELTCVQQDSGQVSQEHMLVWMFNRTAQVHSLLDQ